MQIITMSSAVGGRENDNVTIENNDGELAITIEEGSFNSTSIRLSAFQARHLAKVLTHNFDKETS
jgi:hypothetical protein